MVVTTILTVTGNLPQHRGQLFIVGKNCPAIAVTAQRFARKETGAGQGGQIARAAPVILGTKTLGSIFNNRYSVTLGNRIDGIKIRALPVQRYRDNCFCSGGYRGFKQSRVEIVGERINIDIDRLRPQ
ncbi:hypothetical protein D9M71_664310 [compost metagenome]